MAAQIFRADRKHASSIPQQLIGAKGEAAGSGDQAEPGVRFRFGNAPDTSKPSAGSSFP